MKVFYRPLFIADVTECADYLAAETSETVAAAWYDTLKHAVEYIQATPEIGRLRHDLPVPGIRTLNLRKYPKYLIFYRLENPEIELLRIRHGMMHLPDLFPEKPAA
jgi:toxin ParE1/3/4